MLEQQGKLAQAIAAYRRAVEIYPDFYEFHSSLGKALCLQGQQDDAIALEVIHQRRVLKTIAVNVPRPDVAQTYPQVAEAGISGIQATLNLSKVVDQQDVNRLAAS